MVPLREEENRVVAVFVGGLGKAERDEEGFGKEEEAASSKCGSKEDLDRSTGFNRPRLRVCLSPTEETSSRSPPRPF